MRVALLSICFLPLILACKKQKITQENLAGTWRFTEYTYVKLNTDPNDSIPNFSKTISANGYLTLDENGNGMANWPIIQSLKFSADSVQEEMHEGPVLLTIQDVSKRYNAKDYCITQVNGPYPKTVGIKLLSKKKMSLVILNALNFQDSDRHTRIVLTRE